MAVWVGQRSDNRIACARARQESRSVSLAAPNYSHLLQVSYDPLGLPQCIKEATITLARCSDTRHIARSRAHCRSSAARRNPRRFPVLNGLVLPGCLSLAESTNVLGPQKRHAPAITEDRRTNRCPIYLPCRSRPWIDRHTGSTP